jgi:hypothetical protein
MDVPVHHLRSDLLYTIGMIRVLDKDFLLYGQFVKNVEVFTRKDRRVYQD